VRYRVLGDRGGGKEIVSPRPSDPYAWHAYFVSPVTTTTAPTYQILIGRVEWGKMWDNAQGGRVDGCNLRATWDARVPAVFVFEGVVHDVHTRYQGSRWNRSNGRDIVTWPFPRPATGLLRALSWNISFPRYREFDGRRSLVLNKLNQACPGINSALGERLYGAAGIPVSRVKFVRLHVNGGYYHYVMDYEHPDDAMMKRSLAKGEAMGDLFKSVGLDGDEGPYGWGDERKLDPSCNFTPLQRYGATYDRKTNDWKDSTEFARMIDDMHVARASLPSTTALRAFFAQTFDVDKLTSYVALRNWSVPWDDFFQNHFLYRRADGKWIVFPWDLDVEFGSFAGADSSLYIGEEADASNRAGWWNRLKDSFIKAYRPELIARWKELDKTILAPANVKAKVDEAAALYSLPDAQAAPSGVACDPMGAWTAVKNFADARHNTIVQRLGNYGPLPRGPASLSRGAEAQISISLASSGCWRRKAAYSAAARAIIRRRTSDSFTMVADMPAK